ncbi:MAG: hypothetical protein LBR79_02400 [Oscillospiraceae bacterium]|nr:hypothetical protein [Oscillospiraceae bacterium]
MVTSSPRHRQGGNVNIAAALEKSLNFSNHRPTGRWGDGCYFGLWAKLAGNIPPQPLAGGKRKSFNIFGDGSNYLIISFPPPEAGGEKKGFQLF